MSKINISSKNKLEAIRMLKATDLYIACLNYLSELRKNIKYQEYTEEEYNIFEKCKTIFYSCLEDCNINLDLELE